MSFVHLHLHSQYSLLESTITFEDLIKACEQNKMPAVAVTDYGNMFGTIEFYLAAKKAGIQPILGSELYLAPGSRTQKGVTAESIATGGKQNSQSFPKIVLLAMSLKGYQNLCQLVSKGFTEGFYYKPRIDYEILEKFNEDLICLSSSVQGDIPHAFFQKGREEAEKKILFYKRIFQDRFYLEIQRNGGASRQKDNEELIAFYKEMSNAHGIKMVATNEPHYMKREDAYSQEVMLCIQSGRNLGEDKRPKLPSDQFYFKTAEEMQDLFKDCPEAVSNTLEVAQRCKVNFKLTDEKGNTIYHLPTFPVPSGQTLETEIKKLALEGLNRRFDEAKARHEEISEERKPDYFKRLEFELGVINKMGFNGYFLIVQDFINWAKDQGIPVGPGRGSGAGSLVAYSLRVTDLDPLKYNLLFERFLNPERVSMPDFDVDFCQDRRAEVIEYVTKKYGADCVAQIITFGKLQARAALRDVGRAMGMTFQEVDVIAKLIPEVLGISLNEAVEQEPRLKELMENDPKINSLISTAMSLEGLTRHASIHAAGVIISDKPIAEHGPLYRGAEGEMVIQYDMIHAEKIGLIKFDFLGLKTLTLINNAINEIRKNHKGFENFQTTDISVEDPAIYELLSKGDTAGVFQFEGDGISEFIKKFKPSSFADITAINALYRPGPMNMLDEYLARKQGKIKVKYLFDRLEDILKETYGIIVYQEQVQMIAARCANYSLGEADLLRRAMGKKKPEEMAKQRERFLRGCKDNELDLKKAEELFDLMAKFAEYGFNKSHAAAYCVVAAQTAYLKAKFPAEFYAALLTTEMSDTDKLVWYIRDAKEHNLEVDGPDVNRSEMKFGVKDGHIVFGLGGVKGVGEAAVEAMTEARLKLDGQKFPSLMEFFEKVDSRRANKKVVECLIKAGAFDQLNNNRRQIFESLTEIWEGAEIKKRDNEMGQSSFFQMTEMAEESKAPLKDVPEWPRSIKSAFEKEVLGFYMSDHPLRGIAPIVQSKITSSIGGLNQLAPKSRVTLCGMILDYRENLTKKGDRMAFCNLEDESGLVELVVFPKAFQKGGHHLKGSQAVLITGTLEIDEEKATKVLVDEIGSMESLVSGLKEVNIRISDRTSDEASVRKLFEVIKRHPGNLELNIGIQIGELKKEVWINAQKDVKVIPNEAFLEDLEKSLGNKIEIGIH